MNKVLILSDSHGLTSEITEIKERHNLAYNIHCGDSQLPADSKYLNDFVTVSGNCDWGAGFVDDEVFQIGDLRFLVTHGHLYQVKHSLLNLQYKAEEINADVVCFGHSHIAYAKDIDNKLFINPGSIRLPKQSNVATYTILEWETREQINVSFYSVAGEKLKSFDCSI